MSYFSARRGAPANRLSITCHGLRVDTGIVRSVLSRLSVGQERPIVSALYPEGLHYTRDHEWVRVEEREGVKVATIGVTRFAVEQLGDVTQVDLPEKGESAEQAKAFGSVESVNAVSDLFAPISGTVAKTNLALTDSPEYVNEDPYEKGWMIQIAMSDAKELDALLNAGGYQALLREQGK